MNISTPQQAPTLDNESHPHLSAPKPSVTLAKHSQTPPKHT